MSLDLKKHIKYANAYQTNLNYLDNMTSLQVKLLQEGMGGHETLIYTGLWYVPWAFSNEENVKGSVERFISDLNKELMGL